MAPTRRRWLASVQLAGDCMLPLPWARGDRRVALMARRAEPRPHGQGQVVPEANEQDE